MVTLTIQNFDTLVENEAAAAQAASTQPLNFDTGSVLRAIFEADASQALWLQYLVVLVLSATRLATSSGSDCDTFGEDFDFTRLPGVTATGNVTFSRYSSTQAAFIPVYISASGSTPASGTQVLTSDQTLTFNVVADSTNPNYVASPVEGYNISAGVSSISVPVQADVAGTSGNILANTLTLIVGGILGVDSVTNPSAFTNGVNEESDAAFKARFVNFINSRSQATDEAVGYAIQQIQQGLTWTIEPNQTANGTYTPGTFVVTVDDGTGSPPSSLITSVATAIQNIRPIGSTAIIQAPTKISADVTLTVTVPTSLVSATVISEVTAALTTYIDSLSVGQTLAYSRIPQVAYDADSNISNVTNVTINGGTSDIIPTTSEVVRAGTLVINVVNS